MTRVYVGSALDLVCQNIPSSIITGKSASFKDTMSRLWHKAHLSYQYTAALTPVSSACTARAWECLS